MLNLSKYLTEAENAPITYPDLYKPKNVWKIREDNPSYYGQPPKNGYLTASFVREKSLKWPDLGFNLTVQVMNGGRSLIFLTKEDAELFLKKAYNNYSLPKLVVGRGMGGNELVRVDNDKIGIPIYLVKNSIEWLSEVENTKVPQYIRDRLTGEVSVDPEQKEKETKQAQYKQKREHFKQRLFDIYTSIDPENTKLSPTKNTITITKDNVQIIIETDYHDQDIYTIRSITFKDADFFGIKDELEEILVPDKDERKRLDFSRSYDSVQIFDRHRNSIRYPELKVRSNWDDEKIKTTIINYINTIINIVNEFNTLEDFI